MHPKIIWDCYIIMFLLSPAKIHDSDHCSRQKMLYVCPQYYLMLSYKYSIIEGVEEMCTILEGLCTHQI